MRVQVEHLFHPPTVVLMNTHCSATSLVSSPLNKLILCRTSHETFYPNSGARVPHISCITLCNVSIIFITKTPTVSGGAVLVNVVPALSSTSLSAASNRLSFRAFLLAPHFTGKAAIGQISSDSQRSSAGSPRVTELSNNVFPKSP